MNETEQLLKQVATRARSGADGPAKPLPAPLDAAEPARAALILGFELPPLLAGLHTRVADGGFGPEGGLMPLEDAVATYRAMRGSGWKWPGGVLPIAHWGCGTYVCVDCRSETAQVLLFDPTLGEPDLAWFIDAPSLADWLRGWLDGSAWYCEDSAAGEEYDLDLAPWTDFRSRV